MDKKPNQLLEKLIKDREQLSKKRVFELSIYNPADAADELKIDESPTIEQFFESVKSAKSKNFPAVTTLKKMTAEEGEHIRAQVKEQSPPLTPGTNIVQSMALAMNDKRLKIGITKGVNIYEQQLPQEAADFIERHTGMFKGLTDSTNLTIYPHTGEDDTSFMVITGCKVGDIISYLIYKNTPGPDGMTKITKIGDIIEGTKCSGTFSWH
jgi:hypothetical protein